MKFSVANLSLLNKNEQERQLNEWNATEVEYPSSSCIQDLFLQQVKSNPSAQAIILENKRIYTYQELDYLSNQVASFLIRNGIKEQSRILVLLPASIDFAATVLGVLKAGCIYVPVDISVGEEQLQFILEDIETEVLITTEELKERYYGFSNHIFSSEDFKIENKAFVHNLGSANNVAYIVYSLASTSQSKGISITHRSLVNSVYARGLHFPIPKRLAILYSTSLDITTATLFWAITTGASLVIPSESRGWDIKSALALIEREQISHLIYPPILYRKLLQQAEQSELKSLEVVSLRGDSWPPDILEHHCIICPQANLYNEYGAKEATTWSSLAQVYDSKTKACKEVTIGNPIANTQTYVFNEREQLVPVGVKGEIYLGGVGLAQGYWDHSELNDICFVKHPYKLGERLYKTGDIGCYLEDGRIEYIGKKECQVRVQERRVELERVEYVLRQQQKVAEVVVLLRRVQSGQERLVGYIQLEEKKPEDTTVIEERLQRNLGKQLPIYMIPQIWVFVDRFEITLEGRIDKKNLPEPPREKLNDNIIAPRTEAEKCLAQIWCKILQLEQVSVRDNFFEVGGDSILSIQLVSEARQMGIEINMEQVFESPTIEELAGVAKLSSEHPIIEKGQGVLEQPITLAPIQQWFLEQTVNNAHHYNQAVILESVEDLDPECLEKALQSLIQTHSSLRLRFRQEVSGEWKQQYEPYESLKEYSQGICRIESLEALAEEDIQEKRLSLMNEVQQSLNIIKGPVFQGILFKGQEKDNLFLVCHHLMIDSVSWRILLEDLEKAYKEIHQSGVASLAPEGKSYSWWTHRLIDLVQEQSWKEELGYWEKVLADSQSVLPQWIANEEANTVASLSEVTFELSVRETQQLLQEVPRAYKTQINDVLLTALGFAIKEWTGLDDISLMLEGHGREQLTEEMDLSRTIGWFTSVYPVSFSLAGVEGLGDGIKLVKESLRAIPKKGIGYGMLRYLTSEGRERLSNKKEPELSFNYLGQWDNSIQKNNLFNFAKGSVGNCIALTNQRPRIIEINCQVMNGVLSIHVGYSVNHYQEEKARGLGEKFVERLRALIHHCCEEKHFGYTPSDFPLAKLNQEQLNLAFGSVANIEDIYPLSPMQEGLLFQKLFKPNSQTYFIQTGFVIDGLYDIQKFNQAWEKIVNKFSILRTGFKWIGLEQPLQFVLSKIDAQIQIEEWQETVQSSEELLKYLENLATKEYSLKSPPLMQLRLLRLSSEKYYMIWNFHHIILDGWCTPIIISELLNTYEELIKGGREVPIKPVRPYKDYIAWLYKQDMSYGENFWKKHLSGSRKTILTLPAFKDEPLNEKYETLEKALPTELIPQLSSVAKEYKVTMSDIFQLAWGYLLNRYTQQEDVVFGLTVSGRSIDLREAESMLGVFINTVPQRVKINKTDELSDLLKRIHKQVVQMQQFAYIPLAKIQTLSEEHDKSSLFNTLFIFEGTKIKREFGNSGINIESIVTREQIEYPLTVLVQYQNEQTSLNFFFDNKYFQKAHIEQLIKHYTNILMQITTKEGLKFSSIRLLDKIEEKDLIERWKGKKTDLSKAVHFLEYFQKSTQIAPKKVAVTDNKQSMTYETLNILSNKVARFLTSLNVSPRIPICLYYERSNEYLVGILGIWKAQAIYVPIDPRVPPLRAKNIIKQLGECIIITNKQYTSALKELSNKPFYLIEDILAEELQQEAPELRNQDLNQIAYIIYTSGSTGEPKGVMIEHLAMQNHLNSKASELGLSKSDNVAQTASQSFDVSVWQFIAPLMVEATVVIIKDEDVLDPKHLSYHIFNYNITVLGTVPSLLSILLAGLENSLEFQMRLKTLRQLILIGEPFTENLYKRWTKLYPEVKVINAYGPTECGDAVMHYAITSPTYINNTVPINGTIQNMNIYILDEDLHLVPYGSVGELYVSGAGLARGYYSSPEQTDAVFLQDPFELEKKIYRTGDLVRAHPNGTIYFIGRKDKQVKINGARVEIGEIESILSQHPNIKDVHIQFDKYRDIVTLIAYIIPKNGIAIVANEMHEFLSDKLIDYMRPKYFISLDKFPLTTSGKIDGKKLPNPDYIVGNEQMVKPRNNIELRLFKIWQDILRIENFSIFDSFINLGGHSLLIIRMMLQIRKTFNIDMPINTITNKLTIAELAKEIILNLPYKNPSILTIQKIENHRPLFMIHPITGLAYAYVNLSNYIENYSLYGVNDPYFDQLELEHGSIQDMARKYLEIIREIQPSGPYCLAGWSFGGLVALEMAIQLTRHQEEVQNVILIDTHHPAVIKVEDLKRSIEELLLAEHVSINSIEGQHLFEVVKKNDKLMRRYKPTHYSGRVILIKAQSQELSINAGWENELLPQLKIYPIPGTHYEMMNYPTIQLVAAKMLEVLENQKK